MINVTTNIATVIKRTNKVSKSIDKATDAAFTKLAFDLRAEQQQVMRATFKQVSPYTLGAIRARTPKATGDYTKAGVYFIEQGARGREAHKYLTPNIKGGKRRYKPHEVALWKKGHLPDGYYTSKASGSTMINGAQYQRMLSQLQAQKKDGMNETAKSKGRKKSGGRFFVLYNGDQPIAIAQRFGGSINIELSVGTTTPNYKPIYKFYETSISFTKREFPKLFGQQMKRRVGVGA